MPPDGFNTYDAPKSALAAAATVPAIWFDDAPWSEAAIPQRPWLATGYFIRGAVSLLIGAPGVSKSSVMVGWSVALAFGRSFGKMRPNGSWRVLIYNVEDGEDEQKRRYSAALRHFGASPEDISGRIGRIGPQQIGTLISSDPDTRQIIHTSAMQCLEEHIITFKPDVVLLDPFAELHDREENANVDLRLVIAEFRALARRHNIAVMIAHHTRKGAVTPGDPDAARGASAVIGAVRVALTVVGMTKEEAEGLGLPSGSEKHYFRVDPAKSNYAAPGDTDWFERMPITLDNGDIVAAALPWQPPVDSVSLETRAKIESGIAQGTDGAPWSPRLSNEPRSIRHLFVLHGVTTRGGQKTMLGALLAESYTREKYRATDRSKREGIRAPSGGPTAQWLESEDRAEGEGDE
jgi:AAA domain